MIHPKLEVAAPKNIVIFSDGSGGWHHSADDLRLGIN
jgi:hypothetical protein